MPAFLKRLCWLFTCIMGYSGKKSNQGGLRTWNFQGYWRAYGNSREQVKKEWNLHLIKKIVEFTCVLVFGLGISKGCSTILWNFQRWSFVFSKISKTKVRNLKISGIFSKKYVNHPCLDLFWNSPMLKYARVELKKNPHILGDRSRWNINLKWPLI